MFKTISSTLNVLLLALLIIGTFSYVGMVMENARLVRTLSAINTSWEVALNSWGMEQQSHIQLLGEYKTLIANCEQK